MPVASSSNPDARRLSGQFLRFGVVGGLCFACGLLLVYVLTDLLQWHYLASTPVALVIVNLVGWALNRSWTFRVGRQRSLREFTRYLLVNLAAMAITTAAMALAVSVLGLHYLLACALVAGGMTIVNFVAHRLWSLAPSGG